jgi:hypothetical protein
MLRSSDDNQTDIVVPESLDDLEQILRKIEISIRTDEDAILNTTLTTPSTSIHAALQFLRCHLAAQSNRFYINSKSCKKLFDLLVANKIPLKRHEQQKAKWLASYSACLLLRINWLHHIYQEYFIDRYGIEEKHIRSLLGERYHAYQLIETERLKIACEFIAHDYTEHNISYVQALPQIDLYLFFAIRDLQISMVTSDSKLSIDISTVRFKFAALERMLRAAQSPAVACRAILFLSTSLLKMISFESARLNLASALPREMIDQYRKNLLQLAGSDLLYQGLKHGESLLDAYMNSLGHLQRYTKQLKKKRSNAKDSQTKYELTTHLSLSQLSDLTDKLLSEYQQVATSESTRVISACLAHADPVDLRDAHIGTAGSHLFIIWSTVKLHLMLLTDILDCLEIVLTHFKYTNTLNLLKKAWQSDNPLDKFIMRHNLFSIISSSEWEKYQQNVDRYLLLHDYASQFATFNVQANSFAAKFQYTNPTKVFTNRECWQKLTETKLILSHIQQKIAELKANREIKAQAFYRSLQINEATARRKMSMALFTQSSQPFELTKASTTKSLAEETGVQSETTRTQNLVDPVEKAAIALVQADVSSAIDLFSTTLKSSIFSIKTAQDHIKCIWGLAECYQALAKKCLQQNEKNELVAKAAEHYHRAIECINKALALFPERSYPTINQQLITDRSYLVFILEREFSKLEKRELSYIRAGMQQDMPSPPSNSTAIATPKSSRSEEPCHIPNSVTHSVISSPSTLDYASTPQLKLFFETLLEQKVDFFIYGGAVRDKMLSLPLRDIDICTRSELQKIALVLKNNGYYYESIGTTHPLLQVYLGNITVEISSQHQKQETYASIAMQGLSTVASSFENCDATINAFRFYPATKKLVYLSESYTDLEKKRIGFFTNQSCTARLAADPSLHFRFIGLAAKLQAQGFKLAPELVSAMQEYQSLLPSMDEKDKRRCFVQFCRAFTQGYAQVAWSLLEEGELLQTRTLRDSTFIKIICEHLDDTVANQKTPSLALLISALIFEAFHAKIQLLQQNRLIDLSSITNELDALLLHLEIGTPNPSITQAVKNTLSLWAVKQTPTLRSVRLADTLSYADFLRVETLVEARMNASERATSESTPLKLLRK